MNHLIEHYIDRLLQDPHAPPPHEMDSETAAFVRALVANGQLKPSPALRNRMWQRALDAAKTANQAHSQTLIFRPSSNGHRVHSNGIRGDEPMTPITLPITKSATAAASRHIGVVTLAAAVALVIFGVILLSTIERSGSSYNAPHPGENGSQVLHASATPTALPTGTPIGTPLSATLVPPTTPVLMEYIVQPGDTLFHIIQQPPFNYTDPSVVNDIIRLNPTIVSPDGLPPAGTTILIPLPTPTPTSVVNPDVPGTRLPSNLVAIMYQLQRLMADAQAGEAVFRELSCTGCHQVGEGNVGPQTDYMWADAQNTIMQAGERFAGYTAEMYVAESILHPSSYIAPGYSDIMPDTYGEQLTMQQLADLIAYLRSFALGEAPSPVIALTATTVPTVLPPTVAPMDIAATTATPVPFSQPPAGSDNAIVTAAPVPMQPGTLLPATAVPEVRHLPSTSEPPQISTYVIQEGDTFISLALRFDTTLQTLAELNPQLDFSGCDFARLSGGSTCMVMLQVGDVVQVPVYDEERTSTPTPTPVAGAQHFEGSVTPTPTHYVRSTATAIPTVTPR